MRLEGTLCEIIARAGVAYQNCAESGNETWETHWGTLLETIEKDVLPSGGGFDGGTIIFSATDDEIVFVTFYHHMNESGYYEEWTEHEVRVSPSFQFGIRIKSISGPDKNDIKRYIAETLSSILRLRYVAKQDENGNWELR